MNTINTKENILRTFRKEKTQQIVWQPRLEHWYNVNRTRGLLPAMYQDVPLLDLYRDLDASVRYYYGSGTDISSPRTYVYPEYENGTSVEEVPAGEEILVVFKSPVGELTGRKRWGEWGCSWHYVEHPVKNLDDLPIIISILKNTHFRFDSCFYQEAQRAMRENGEIQFYWHRSPFQRLLLEYLGIERLIEAIYDEPENIREYLHIAEEAENELFELLASCPVKILNFGENIDGRFDSPRIYQEYLLPYYQRRVSELHRAGKFCHIHMDGSLRPLLPFLQAAGFDGIEGATPLPQGDVTLEELKDAMGDTILLDGIPMLLFLPSYPLEELEVFTRRVLKLFSPHLILGISDEISPPGDIERVRLVSRWVNEFQP
ncbi:MAG: hypothetical protein NTX88_08130 [Candidatus Atribacteria bacterium]|nr:hypothetical protein [Candidatus Atribacteria bacterium]